MLLNHNAKNIDSDGFLKDFLNARDKRRKSRIWILFFFFFIDNESFKKVFSKKFSWPSRNFRSKNLLLEVTINAGKNTGKNQSIPKGTKRFYVKLKMSIVSNNLTLKGYLLHKPGLHLVIMDLVWYTRIEFLTFISQKGKTKALK